MVLGVKFWLRVMVEIFWVVDGWNDNLNVIHKANEGNFRKSLSIEITHQ